MFKVKKMNDKYKKKWCCYDEQFHNKVKELAARKGMKILPYTHQLAKKDDPFDDWQNKKGKKKLKYQII